MIWVGLVFCLAAVVQLGYYFLAGSNSSPPPGSRKSNKAGISIIVCARNEAENLKAHIPLWLGQSVFDKSCPPSYARRTTDSELIIVDDYSTDQTAEVVRSFCGPDSPIRLLRPPAATREGKKDALAYAISQARHDCLLLTDADCEPASPRWAELMTTPLQDSAQLVVGHGAYDCSGSTWLGRWQAFAAEYHGIQYRTLTQTGWTQLGVGRNLAYTKRFFYARAGLSKHMHLVSGDDDLLLQTKAILTDSAAAERPETNPVQNQMGRPAEVQKIKPACVVTHPDGWTFSAPAASWSDYAARKRRHFSVGGYYATRSQWILTALAASHGLFYLLGLVLLFTPWRWWALGVYALRMLLVWRAYPRRMVWLPIYDALLCFYLIWQAGLTLLAEPRQAWEERQ